MTAVAPTKGDDGEGQRHLGEGQKSEIRDCKKLPYIYMCQNYFIDVGAGLRVHIHMLRGYFTKVAFMSTATLASAEKMKLATHRSVLCCALYVHTHVQCNMHILYSDWLLLILLQHQIT